jgi:ABC-2 type transport system permease protein
MQNPENPKGVIFDAGYRHYEGRYLGRASAIASLFWDDFKRGLGVKRSLLYKIGIWLLIVPQLARVLFLIISSQFMEQVSNETGSLGALSNPLSAFLAGSSILLLLLTALVVPNLLCRDRKNNVLPLYMVHPITVYDYLISKGLAAFLILGLYLVGPALLLAIGKMFLAPNAIQYIADNQTSLGALLISGVLIVFFYASYAMGVSSLTTGIGIAAALIIGPVFLIGTVTTIVFLTTRDSTAMLFNFESAIYRIKDWIFFGQIPSVNVPLDQHSTSTITIDAFPVWVYGAITLLIILGGWIIAFFVYKREAHR